MPVAVLAILKALLSTLGALAAKWAMKLVAGPAVEQLLLSVAEKAAAKSDNKIDDEVIEILKKKQTDGEAK